MASPPTPCRKTDERVDSSNTLPLKTFTHLPNTQPTVVSCEPAFSSFSCPLTQLLSTKVMEKTTVAH